LLFPRSDWLVLVPSFWFTLVPLLSSCVPSFGPCLFHCLVHACSSCCFQEVIGSCLFQVFGPCLFPWSCSPNVRLMFGSFLFKSCIYIFGWFLFLFPYLHLFLFWLHVHFGWFINSFLVQKYHVDFCSETSCCFFL
jgi:hypothetical protein